MRSPRWPSRSPVKIAPEAAPGALHRRQRPPSPGPGGKAGGRKWHGGCGGRWFGMGGAGGPRIVLTGRHASSAPRNWPATPTTWRGAHSFTPAKGKRRCWGRAGWHNFEQRGPAPPLHLPCQTTAPAPPTHPPLQPPCHFRPPAFPPSLSLGEHTRARHATFAQEREPRWATPPLRPEAE